MSSVPGSSFSLQDVTAMGRERNGRDVCQPGPAVGATEVRVQLASGRVDDDDAVREDAAVHAAGVRRLGPDRLTDVVVVLGEPVLVRVVAVEGDVGPPLSAQ